jgi:hypothetical protein
MKALVEIQKQYFYISKVLNAMISKTETIGYVQR